MVWKSLSARKRPKPSGAAHPCHDHGRTYGFDQVLFVKGFGAIVSGWQLIGRGRLQNMSLTIGGRTLELDRRCLVTIPRPDLQGLAPQPDMVWTAGFRAVLHGPTIESLGGERVLSVELEGGISRKLAIPMDVVRPAAGPEALDSIVDYFPSFAHEPFLPAFADAFATTVRARAGDALMVAAAKARNVVVLVLPRHWDDMFLMMNAVFRFQSALPPDVGLALLMSPEHPRVRVLDRFGELGFRSGRPMSLFEVIDSAYSLWSLTPALEQIGAERFLFCGPDAVLTGSGWNQVASYFASGRTGLELFLTDEARGGSGPEPESLGFAWTTSAFVEWAGTAPFFFSGFHRDNRLPTDSASGRHQGAISLLRLWTPSEAIRRADERLYQTESAAEAPLRGEIAGATQPRMPTARPPRPVETALRASGRPASDIAAVGVLVGGAAERTRVS